MAHGYHADLTGTNIHVPYAWSYADAAARAAASGFAAGDVGKLALQEDDNSLWILTATTPTWVAVAGSSAIANHDHSGDAGDGGTFDAANLTAGASTDGQVLTSDGAGGAAWESPAAASGGYDEGTSFPVSPTLNDKYYRTDRNQLYYYDGTRWLTTTLYHTAPGLSDGASVAISAAADIQRWPVWTDDSQGMYLVHVKLAIYVATTNSGSAYWTYTLKRSSSNNTTTDIVSVNTSADSPNTWYEKTVAIGAVLDASAVTIKASVAKTSTPGGLVISAILAYRLVG